VQKLIKAKQGFIDVSVVMTIVTAFIGLMVCSYIIYKVIAQLAPTGNALTTTNNISAGFDNAINLILVAITIWVLAIAISALLILRGRRE
jgi:hypothetical protein